MVRIIEYRINNKENSQTGIIKSIDTESGIINHYDYIVGQESEEILDLITNYDMNGILEDYEQYFPENPKILKENRT
jgi:uncharacterized protein YutD